MYKLLAALAIKALMVRGLSRSMKLLALQLFFNVNANKDSVVPHLLRDFRGTMQGRADKGIIMTTGRFTSEAKREAVRDGVTPIELVDGERLVSLFEKYQLGLIPKIVYDLVPDFFDHFK